MAIRSEDFKKPNGSTDWDAYTKAKVAAGEVCSSCGEYIVSGAYPKGPRTCGSCQQLIMCKDSVQHDHFIRCPKCGDYWDPMAEEDDVFSDGQHAVCCNKCDHEFEVTTTVTYTFESPDLEKNDAEDEDEHGDGGGPDQGGA